MKTASDTPLGLQKLRQLPHWFWRGVDWWGRHQRYWWLTVGALTLTWLAYDVGRVVARADLVRMGGEPRGALELSDVEAKAKEMGGGRLLITSPRSARFLDAAGQAWEVPAFGTTINRGSLERLKEYKVTVDGDVSIDLTPVKTSSRDVLAATFFDIAIKLGFIGFYVFIIYLILRHLSNSKGQRFRSVSMGEKPSFRISDVAGHEGAKREVLEVVDYLKDPSRYEEMGARPPSGVLMYGPPGNGKTLLAKAIAGEAKAHFIEQSASAFVQIYAGEGARAVRRLFEEARKNQPCVVFIDEIDAIGASRSGGGHDERIQTINALLTEMDGFGANDGIVVVAATNRLEVLDEALVRPGRFDRKVHIPLPSRDDRLAILKVHAKRLPRLTANLEHWANQTQGFSGASLASLVNEAAIEAARSGAANITDLEFAAARDRVLIGARDLARRPTERDRQFVAFHELGHALMRLRVGGKVEKVSIQPRGLALGVTVTATPEDESALRTEEEIRQEITVLMGGRAAEEVFCGAITTGAADDMARASQLARQALLRYGFEEHGPYVPESSELLKEMEEKARALVLGAYRKALETMRENEAEVRSLVHLLVEKEELSGLELEAVLLAKPSQGSA